MNNKSAITSLNVHLVPKKYVFQDFQVRKKYVLITYMLVIGL